MNPSTMAMRMNAPAPPVLGASAEALFIADENAKCVDHLRRSHAFGAGLDKAHAELAAVAAECRTANWDGYDARPVAGETVAIARHLLDVLPLGAPAPSISADPDGQVTLEWHAGPRRVLSVSADPAGDLHYAALIGPRNPHATEPFFGEFPAAIFDLIKRVYAA